MAQPYLRIKRHLYFTLVEILLVMAVVLTIAGIFGISIAKTVRDQRFRSEVALLVDQMRLAQDLMLIFNGDVHLKIKVFSDKGYEYKLAFDHPLPKQWMEQLQKPGRRLIQTIHAIDFHEENDFPEEGADEIDFRFLSGGAAMSRGIIRFATSESYMLGTLETYVCLKGIPGPIITVAKRPSEDSCDPDLHMDELLTSKTVEELRSLSKS